MSADLHRYHRQMLLPPIRESGQRRLRRAHALLAGCGALGSVIADSLVRAGIGTLTIVDRDVVEITNLQRQVLFDEDDAAAARPKAIAAQQRLARINGDVQVRAFVEDLDHRSIGRIAEGAHLILDGLDNFETRYLLNDFAVARGLPYIYGGAVGTAGMTMTILPHPGRAVDAHDDGLPPPWDEAQATACLRCLFPEPPPPGMTPTCDTAGVLGPTVVAIAAHQAAEAIKLCTAGAGGVRRSLLSLDLWSGEARTLDISAARRAECACCGRREFTWLAGRAGASTTALCGRGAVQVAAPSGGATIDLVAMGGQLRPHGHFDHNGYILRGTFAHEHSESGAPIELTLFPDGRAIIGVSEPDRARAIYAKYIGA